MASKVIETFIKKALFKKGGAMANNKAVKFSADALEKRIKNFARSRYTESHNYYYPQVRRS